MVSVPMTSDANLLTDSLNSGKTMSITPSTKPKNVEASKTICSVSTVTAAISFIPLALCVRRPQIKRMA